MEREFLTLKGQFSIFEVGLYEVIMYGECITFCRRRSVVSLLGRGGNNRSTGHQHCAIADRVSRKLFYRLI